MHFSTQAFLPIAFLSKFLLGVKKWFARLEEGKRFNGKLLLYYRWGLAQVPLFPAFQHYCAMNSVERFHNEVISFETS